MPHPEDRIAIALAAWGNRAFSAPARIPWPKLEDGLGVDLTGGGRHLSTALVREADGTTLPPSAWVEALPGRGATALRLLEPPPSAGGASAKGGFAVPGRILHAFVGAPLSALGVVVGGEVEVCRPTVRVPRETDLTWADVLAFIASQPDSAGLREHLLWQDAHNLHLTDGSDWSRFEHAVRPEHWEEVVRTMGRVVGNARFSRGEDRAWYTLTRRRRDPRYAPSYVFELAGRAASPAPAPGVDAQSRRLADGLEAILAFARETSPDPWVALFRAALDVLRSSGRPTDDLARLLEGAGLSDAALRLLVAADRSDVFGGMGSWNDLAVAGEASHARYEAVSDGLFREIAPGLRSALEPGA